MTDNTKNQSISKGCCRWLKILFWGEFKTEFSAEDLKKLEVHLSKAEVHLDKIYEEQMEWARHFNQLIWTISAIIIPASLAGLALSFRNDNGDFMFGWFWAATVGSFALVFYWALQVFWHVALWRRAFILTGIIEKIWGVRDSSESPIKYEEHLLSKLTGFDLGKLYIWIFIILFMVAWGIRGLAEWC